MKQTRLIVQYDNTVSNHGFSLIITNQGSSANNVEFIDCRFSYSRKSNINSDENVVLITKHTAPKALFQNIFVYTNCTTTRGVAGIFTGIIDSGGNFVGTFTNITVIAHLNYQGETSKGAGAFISEAKSGTYNVDNYTAMGTVISENTGKSLFIGYGIGVTVNAKNITIGKYFWNNYGGKCVIGFV